jgi:hypothetical protein
MMIYGVPYINISYFTPRNHKFRKEYYRNRTDTYETLHLVSQRYKVVDFFHGSTAPSGPSLLYDTARSHSNTAQAVGLLWTSDRPVAETSV